MLRVSGNNVLVVPPFECAWLSSDEHQLRDGRGCIFFQVKGENDITIIIKRLVGSKRWQHMQRAEDSGHHAPQVDPNYTIILGSHGNRCLKIERNGILCCMVHDVIGARVTGDVFSSYWLDYDNGAITIGAGTPSTPSGVHRWVDPQPLEGLRFVGLSSWDKHVAYRNISVGPCLADARRWGTAAPPLDDQALDHVPALVTLAAGALVAHLAPDSVVPLLVVADLPLAHAPRLREAALAFLAANAESVLRAVPHHLPRLSVVHVEEMLCHAELTCSEIVVFEFVLVWSGAAWVSHAGAQGDDAPYHSLAELERVLPRIRFPLMLPDELNNIAGHPLASTSPVLQQLLAEARADGRGCAVQAPPRCPYEVCDRRLVRAAPSEAALAAARFQRRASPKWRELLFINNGDANGLCASLGTNGGAQTWVNPVLAGRLAVRASSPSCRHTDLKAIVGRQPLHTNYAGPRVDRGAPCAWWALDLGPQHRLVCNHYSLRHDASPAFPRDWALQGSEDGQVWVDLRVHTGDKALSMPQQYASWSVQGPGTAKAMRWFRVVLRAPCADGSWQLHLSNIELYGYLLAVP